jgi:ATP/maltotriose-dependent transcriptional regulator MalT
VHISRLESNQSAPDPSTLLALFVPALGIQGEPELVARLLELGETTRGERAASRAASPPAAPALLDTRAALEAIPPAPRYEVVRENTLTWLRERLMAERAVAICAMAGMGKTTLAAALAREQASARPVLWMTLTAGVNASLDAVVRQLALFLLSNGQGQVAPLIQRLDGTARPISLNQQIALVGAALTQLGASGATPLLCFDNVHLALGEPTLLQLLHHLVATPTLLLLTSRTDMPLPSVVALRLAGFDRAEGLRLIGRLDGGLTRELAERLLNKTGGSPMLLRLAIGYLHEGRGDTAAALARLEHAPHIAAYLLDTLLADLAPPTLHMLTLLALFRKPVDLCDETLLDMVQAAGGCDDLPAALAEARRWHLIDHPAQATLHPLVRDQIAATLTPDMRRRLHRIAAAWSEQTAMDLVEAAYHYTCADDLERACEALTDRRSLLLGRGQAYAAVEVVDDLLARARRRRDDQTSLIRRLLLIRGDLLARTLRTGEAEANYGQALALTTQPKLRAYILQRLADSLAQRGQAAEARRLCQEARAALSASDTLLLAQLACSESRASMTVSEHDAALQSAEQALALADQIAEVLPRRAAEIHARTRLVVGSILRVRQQFDAALAHFQDGIAAVQQAGTTQLESQYDVAIGGLLFAQGDLWAALAWCDETLPRLQARGEILAAGRLLDLRAFCLLYRGEITAALDAVNQAQAIMEVIGDAYGLAYTQIRRSRILIALGRTAEARPVLESALTAAESAGGLRDLGYLLDRLAMVEMIREDATAAQATLRRALALTTAEDDTKLRADLRQHLVVAMLMAGAVDTAEELFAEPPQSADPPLDMERQLIRGLILLARGDSSAAASIASDVAVKAGQAGYELFSATAAQVLAATTAPPLLATFPRLLWVVGDDPSAEGASL